MVTSTFAAQSWWAVAALILAAAVGSWPGTSAPARLAVVLPGARRGPRAPGWLRVLPAGRVRVGLAVAAAVLVGLGLAGPGGAAAAAMVTALACHLRRSAARGRAADRELAALLDAVGVMSAELRAGAHPASAAAAAATGTAAVHRVLASVSTGARLGAEVPALLRRHAGGEPAIADELDRVAAAWTLADRHGVALAELIDAVRADLDARVRLAGQVRAQLAGPRATAAVLAGLPLLGVLLGQGIGANPWQVLTSSAAGQLLLVLGAGLVCAGMLWSGRIMARAVPR